MGFFHPAKVLKLQEIFCSLASQNQEVWDFFIEKANKMLKNELMLVGPLT